MKSCQAPSSPDVEPPTASHFVPASGVRRPKFRVELVAALSTGWDMKQYVLPAPVCTTPEGPSAMTLTRGSGRSQAQSPAVPLTV